MLSTNTTPKFEVTLSPEEELHGPGECLEVDLVVERAVVADVAEEGHADDGVDEGDEREEGADVEQRRQRHDQREQQLTDPLRGLMRKGQKKKCMGNYEDIEIYVPRLERTRRIFLLGHVIQPGAA